MQNVGTFFVIFYAAIESERKVSASRGVCVVIIYLD
jgi:hypothetical protein